MGIVLKLIEIVKEGKREELLKESFFFSFLAGF
jgi:hypothetical protein